MKLGKKYTWHKIAQSATELFFASNNLGSIEIDGKKVCVAKTETGLAACSIKCPHAGGDMSQGFLDKNGNIICPIHRYVFSLKNGRDVSGEGYFLKTYPVKITDEGVFVGFEESGLFSWLK